MHSILSLYLSQPHFYSCQNFNMALLWLRSIARRIFIGPSHKCDWPSHQECDFLVLLQGPVLSKIGCSNFFLKLPDLMSIEHHVLKLKFTTNKQTKSLCLKLFALKVHQTVWFFFFFFLFLQKHPVLAHFEETSMSYSKRATRQRTSAGDGGREKEGKPHSSSIHTRSGDLIWQTGVLGQKKIPIEKNADIC